MEEGNSNGKKSIPYKRSEFQWNETVRLVEIERQIISVRDFSVAV